MSAHFFETSARSAIGLVRQGNEDSGFISPQLIAVADGMGGHAAGEVASRIAVEVLQSLVPALVSTDIDEDSVEDLLMHSLHSIDSEISVVADEEIEKRGMGTTLTALLIRDKYISLLHVGDSRCYRLRGNTLEQLSNDHTVMQELIDQGRITPDEAVNHPQRSLLTHALMGDSGFDPVVQLYPIKLGDQFLLCSDGLTGVLSDFEITKIIKKYDGQELVENLVAETRAKGAPDNVTVIWAEVVLEEDASSTSLIGAAHA